VKKKRNEINEENNEIMKEENEENEIVMSK